MLTIKNLFITGVLILYTNLCFTQIVGKCIDKLGNPIPYINVSVKKSIIGTVSNEDGVFRFKENLQNEIDSLVFSHIGYITQTISSDRNDSIIVILQPSQYQLREVNISASETIYKNEKIIGTKASTDHVVLSFLTHNLGSEIGKLIKIKKGKKCKVEKVFFNISQFDFIKSTFRINFYNVAEDDKIENVRVNFSDIVKDSFKNGLIEIDVSDDNLVFENDFLVSIEWIDYIKMPLNDPKKENIINFNSSVFSGPSYYRPNNIINWTKNKFKYNSGIGIHLSVKY